MMIASPPAGVTMRATRPAAQQQENRQQQPFGEAVVVTKLDSGVVQQRSKIPGVNADAAAPRVVALGDRTNQ